MFDVASPQADLIVAKKIFYDKERVWTVNPEMLNLAAYHSAQAVEKLLKLYVREKSEELFNSISHSHNISEVLIKLEFCRKGFVGAHPDIALNADIITRMNRLRYGDGQISRDDCYAILTLAKNLCNEYLAEYLYTKHTIKDRDDDDRIPQYHFRDTARMMEDIESFGR